MRNWSKAHTSTKVPEGMEDFDAVLGVAITMPSGSRSAAILISASMRPERFRRRRGRNRTDVCFDRNSLIRTRRYRPAPRQTSNLRE
jgi:hypothetical protein